MPWTELERREDRKTTNEKEDKEKVDRRSDG